MIKLRLLAASVPLYFREPVSHIVPSISYLLSLLPAFRTLRQAYSHSTHHSIWRFRHQCCRSRLDHRDLPLSRSIGRSKHRILLRLEHPTDRKPSRVQRCSPRVQESEATRCQQVRVAEDTSR
jgi:hypothetical protein